MSEIELKLQLAAQSAILLHQASLFSGRGTHHDQHAIYFDTADRALERNGLSLRIRRQDGRRVQTTKLMRVGSVGLFARSEWEKLVDDDMPVLDDVTPVRAVLGDGLAALVQAFHVDNDRRVWLLQRDGAQIEVALDNTRIHRADRHALSHEIELELISGPAVALFSLARDIADLVSVRIGVLSKSQRGYSLIDKARDHVPAVPVPLNPGMAAAEAFANIATSCLRQFRLNEDLLLQNRDPEALHQARVALRRLRVAFSLFRPMLGDAGQRFREDLRWLAQELGPARDLDVMLERAAHNPLAAQLRPARADAYDRAVAALESRRALGLLLALTEWLAVGDWRGDPDHADQRDRPADEFAAQALARYRRKVKRHGKHLSDLSDDARHELRKDAKKLRYAADFFEPLFDTVKARRKFLAPLKKMQDQLGALNDIATAPLLLERLGLEDDPAAADLLAHRSRASLLDKAARAYDGLVGAPRFWQ